MLQWNEKNNNFFFMDKKSNYKCVPWTQNILSWRMFTLDYNIFRVKLLIYTLISMQLLFVKFRKSSGTFNIGCIV